MNKAKHQSAGATLPFHGLPVVRPAAGFSLLSGIRVLDLTTSVAGPFATMLLADMGAEVIKIERPGAGDDARGWGPPFLDGESLWFLSVNRNKQSLTLDYSRPEGLAVLHDLIGKADVVMVNQPPRVSKKLGTDPASLAKIKPDLIYVSITGFGIEGERADWTCYDLIAEGYSGVMDLTGEQDGDPQKIGAPAADMLAGQDAALATLACIIDRGRTGNGKVVDIALVDSMTRFLTCRIVPYLGSGELPQRSGGKDSVIAIYQTFQTADLPMTLGLGNDNIWRKFWEAVGRPEMASDTRFATNADRRTHRSEIVGQIQAVLVTRTRAHWLSLLRAARIPAGPISTLEDVVEDPHLRKRGLFFRLDTGTSDVPQVGTGFCIDGQSNIPRAAPPKLGEHTAALLDKLLGYGQAQTNALRAKGVI